MKKLVNHLKVGIIPTVGVLITIAGCFLLGFFPAKYAVNWMFYVLSFALLFHGIVITSLGIGLCLDPLEEEQNLQ